ncbi:COG4339 metal-dependent phosphohydrolase, HD superfamily [hydrothermal vent metagenome]|uniref:COG4339 metal-dependent phosphohydrolase, HD superfamily n=1 Tax=hydrothermal vent metagenome TaxID=652676 RepID=A0A3B0W5D7_9ZZZZ
MNAMGLPDSDECYVSLHEAYSKRNRHYHSTVHIDAMLRHYDVTADLAEYPHQIELAIWFHDAIYKPLSSSNEKDSADWAKDFLAANDYDVIGIDRVYKLIMATQHHGEVVEHDEKLIVDIDLTILATPNHIYDQFEVNVRKEYWLVPSFIYRKKRKQLLQGFLDQNSIYNLGYFINKYEQSARDNIARAISLL